MTDIAAKLDSQFDERTVLDFGKHVLKDRLLHAAAIIRKAAMWSIVDGKGRHESAPAGRPPYSHKYTLKNRIAFAWDESTQSAVVGPEFVPGGKGQNVAPGVLEHGGTATITTDRHLVRQIGWGGEIRTTGAVGKTTKPVKDNRGVVRLFTYIKIKTARQLTRSNDLNYVMFGPQTRTATIRPHPYMGPAFDKNVGRLDSMFSAAA